MNEPGEHRNMSKADVVVVEKLERRQAQDCHDVDEGRSEEVLRVRKAESHFREMTHQRAKTAKVYNDSDRVWNVERVAPYKVDKVSSGHAVTYSAFSRSGVYSPT